MSILKPYEQLWPKQVEFLHCDDDVTMDICLYQGGFGSGKTWVGVLLGLCLTQVYPGILGLVLAKTFPMVRDTTLRTYFEHLDSWGWVKGKDFDFNKSESTLSFPNGSEVMFRHLQDPEKIKSINAGFIEIEEASQLSEADFNMCVSRLRQAGIPRKRLFGHSNPQPSRGWIYDKFVEKNNGKQVLTDEEGNQEVIVYRRVIAPTTDNKALPLSYIENMRHQYDPEYFRINVLGEDGDYTAGLMCKMWSELNETDTSYKPDLKLYLTCDFNVDPMCWAIFHRYNDEYHFIDEIVMENTTTIATTEEFFSRYGDHRSGLVVCGDASGDNRSTQANKVGGTNYTQILNRLSELGFKGSVMTDIRSGNPPIQDRIASWNAMVCNKKGVRRIFANKEKCKYLIKNCRDLKYIEGTSQLELPTAHDISKDRSKKFIGHMFDAASYPVEKYDPITLKVKTPLKGTVVPTAMRNL